MLRNSIDIILHICNINNMLRLHRVPQDQEDLQEAKIQAFLTRWKLTQHISDDDIRVFLAAVSTDPKKVKDLHRLLREMAECAGKIMSLELREHDVPENIPHATIQVIRAILQLCLR